MEVFLHQHRLNISFMNTLWQIYYCIGHPQVHRLSFVCSIWFIVLSLCQLALTPYSCELVLQLWKWNSSWTKDDNGAFIVQITFILVFIFLLKGSHNDVFSKSLLYIFKVKLVFSQWFCCGQESSHILVVQWPTLREWS